VYKHVFDEIEKDDTPYYETDERPPSFGNSNSTHDDVHLFYSYWQSYSTPKTYMYIGKYSTLDAPNRRVSRLMEKENNKLREAAKKQRNQEVRVSYLLQLFRS